MKIKLKDRLNVVRSFLSEETTVALATVNEDGTPRSTPLFFISDSDLHLYWFSSVSSTHSRNCERSPRASLAVFGSTARWQEIRGIQMEGLVSKVTDRRVRRDIADRYRGRYALNTVLGIALRRSSLYEFTPLWLRWIDNTERFGYRFEFAFGTSKLIG